MPKNKNGVIGALLVVGLVGGVMVGAYVVNTPNAQRVPDELRKAPLTEPDVEVSRPAGTKPHTFQPELRGGDLYLNPRSTEIPEGVDPKVFVVNEFLNLTEIAPAGSKLLGVDVRDGVAYLDFNREFDSTYGSQEEQVLVNGILALMAQFPGVERVQIQIQGEPMETMGHLDLSEPQPVIELDEQNRPKYASVDG